MGKEFSVFMIQSLDKEDCKSNGGFHHPTYKATMFITKEGVSIKLTSDEIKQVVKAACGNFNR
jgi:hypothetical protein